MPETSVVTVMPFKSTAVKFRIVQSTTDFYEIKTSKL